ncbi:MAG: hypothetical protein Q9168_003935 [Polycauliona sp. 1 TL-2023]
MPRKAFIHDLQQCVQSYSHRRVSGVQSGVEDGSVTFRYTHDAEGHAVVIQALVTDVGDYPASHMYMIYTTSENIPAQLSTALEDVGTLDGCNISQMLSKVAKTLDDADAGSQSNPLELDDDAMDTDEHLVDGSDPDADDDSDLDPEEVWSPGSPSNNASSRTDSSRTSDSRNRSAVLSSNRRIRSDLRLVKQAGFRVGHLGGLIDNAQDCFVTVSIRVSKLGISEEAMQAWHLKPQQYFLLLIRYTAGYRSLDDLMASGNFHRSKDVIFRTGLSQHYKIPINEAVEAFSQLKKKPGSSGDRGPSERADADGTPGMKTARALQPLSIGGPLQDLMNERLLAMINYRSAMGFGWGGAESYYLDHQGSNLLSNNVVDNKYYAPETSSRTAALPKLVTNDHLSAAVTKPSFPLIAMEFALRHLVRCTEFCLVCHERVEADFEALKPYVCSKPLCLYQYMAFGFGPSIEHDIVAQPHVVDLLISFCYSSAAFGTLKNLPTGLALAVPAPSLMPTRGLYPYRSSPFSHVLNQKHEEQAIVKQSIPSISYKAKFDQSNMELILSPGEVVLFPNQWIYVMVPGTAPQNFHCRVVEALHPTIRLGPAICVSDVSQSQDYKPPSQSAASNPRGPGSSLLDPTRIPAPTAPASEVKGAGGYPEVQFVIYDQNFDDLSFADKQNITCMLLETLPGVLEMKNYLQSKSGKDMSLKEWQDRISPAAAGVLRWIIASNRSCIVEVDHLVDGGTHASEERVTGMPSWMQFRFAQGAPDKEQRFIQSIRDVTGQQPYPSLYAWHGSPLQNWHSIVREGLHFQDTANGRAFGHGVYHATDVSTSLGYSGGFYHHSDGSSPAASGTWPQSHLKISQAIALNEIVNAPTQFVSHNPHLVVAQLDWIQTRYLFVKINDSNVFDKDVPPKEIYAQDPKYTPSGSGGQKIVIPITAVSKSRRPLTTESKNGSKKMKIGNVVEADDCAILSDDTDVEDLQILIDEDEDGHEKKPPVPAKNNHHADRPKPQEAPKTDFVPGTLDPASLPLLEPPLFATSMATKALQRELNSTLKIQESLPAHELGWYINRELLNNMYQWIIELHSFESHLPLAKDLKTKDLKSVVLEVRFGKDYPMSPPFVRIIRPRFLSFMAGGGGHVTAGGALCMELLTNSGWSAVSNMESVLLQVRLALSSTDPKPARLEPGKVRDYDVGEAIEAYIRACHTHGSPDGRCG